MEIKYLQKAKLHEMQKAESSRMAFVLFLYAAAVSAIISLAAVIPFAHSRHSHAVVPVQWMNFVRKSQAIVRATNQDIHNCSVRCFVFYFLAFGFFCWYACLVRDYNYHLAVALHRSVSCHNVYK